MDFLKKRIVVLGLIVLLSVAITVSLTGCGPKEDNEGGAQEKEPIVFADAGWGSIRFHNEVARLILEKGYGYETDVIPGSTPATFTGLREGDIDVYMELWTQNIIDMYNEAIEAGEIIEASTNFDDNAQGLYVPAYVIKGDSDRGIEPMAPGLETVKDLEEYWEVFKDPEDATKGRIVGSPPGWKVDELLRAKVTNYGLDKTYNYFSPGSDSSLAAAIASAYKKGEPIVAYYWEPTWLIGMYDMTLLGDEEYSDEKWNNGYACEWPAIKVTIAVNSGLPDRAPEVVEFLKNYKTSSALTSEALAYMQENEVEARDAAEWFLNNKEDVWTEWVPEDIANKVKDVLK